MMAYLEGLVASFVDLFNSIFSREQAVKAPTTDFFKQLSDACKTLLKHRGTNDIFHEVNGYIAGCSWRPTMYIASLWTASENNLVLRFSVCEDDVYFYTSNTEKPVFRMSCEEAEGIIDQSIKDLILEAITKEVGIETQRIEELKKQEAAKAQTIIDNLKSIKI